MVVTWALEQKVMNSISVLGLFFFLLTFFPLLFLYFFFLSFVSPPFLFFSLLLFSFLFYARFAILILKHFSSNIMVCTDT